MKNKQSSGEHMLATRDWGRSAALLAAVHLICAANEVSLREQKLAMSSPPAPAVEIDLESKQPFGFAFTEGHLATFNVPRGHRFVIEHVDVSCWGNGIPLSVHLVSRSPRMYRSVTLECALDRPSADTSCDATSSAAGLAIECSSNTFLFSNDEVQNSSTVPRDTYLQVWGYLEPTHWPDGF